MSKVAVVYWSSTGNTESMANAVADGAKAAGAEVSVFETADFDAAKVDGFDAIVLSQMQPGFQVGRHCNTSDFFGNRGHIR